MFNLERSIKTSPVYIYFSAIILGMSTVFGMFAYANNYLGFEIEKKGTYIYYQDFYLNVEQNYVSRILYDNLALENKSLRETVFRNNTQNRSQSLEQINNLKIELENKSKEMIRYTTPMRINLNGEQESININTEKYSILKEDIESLRSQIDLLYSKL